jgi:transposase
MDTAHRLLLRQSLDLIDQLRRQAEELDQEIARLFEEEQDAIGRLCAAPGISLTAAFQVVAEIGPQARTCQSGKTGVVGRLMSRARRERGSIS